MAHVQQFAIVTFFVVVAGTFAVDLISSVTIDAAAAITQEMK